MIDRTKLRIPNGTLLFAEYKGSEYGARVVYDEFDKLHVLMDGQLHRTLTAAANHATGTNRNGWQFWSIDEKRLHW